MGTPATNLPGRARVINGIFTDISLSYYNNKKKNTILILRLTNQLTNLGIDFNKIFLF